MLKRANLHDQEKVSDTLKEAVADSLLNTLYNRVSGSDKHGEIITGHRPSAKLISGFLEPAYIAKNAMSATVESINPLHVISTGIDIQIRENIGAKLIIKPEFSIYVRILPNTEDLITFPSPIEFNATVSKSLREKRSEVSDSFKLANKELFEKDKNSYYLERKSAQLNGCISLLKDKFNVVINNIEQEKNIQNTDESDEYNLAVLSEGEAPEVDETTSMNEKDFSFLAFPGMDMLMPDGVAKNITPIQKWLRLPVKNTPELTIFVDDINNSKIDDTNKLLNIAIQTTLKQWLEDESPMGGKLWAFPKGLKVSPMEIKNWEQTLKNIRNQYHKTPSMGDFSLPRINLEFLCDKHSSVDIKDTCALHLVIENTTENKGNRSYERDDSIFQVCLNSRLEKKHHVPLRMDRIKPSYRYNKYLQHSAVGFNSGLTSHQKNDEIIFKTSWMPKYYQPRIRPNQYKDIDVRFTVLQTKEGVKNLENIYKNFATWLEITKSNVDPTNNVFSKSEADKEQHAFRNDQLMWQDEAEKIQKGISLLIISCEEFQKNPVSELASPWRAWVYMNKSMNMSALEKNYDCWRLFQVAFILSNIAGIVSRLDVLNEWYDEEWDEKVSLLYFATGGGKSEAFFGLVIFNLFFDRLRGKTKGVTALLRYPLRLLTIQQAQRLTKSLSYAEIIKEEESIAGDSFSIGFWVGSSNTPNWLSNINQDYIPNFTNFKTPNESDLLKKSSEYKFANESWNKLPSCPFCGSETGLRKFPKLGGTIGHLCFNDKCKWHGFSDKDIIRPLPFYIIDEDIYETCPSIILGTVDKLALIGNSPTTIRMIFGMFGAAPYRNIETDRLHTCNSAKEFELAELNNSLEPLYPFFTNGNKIFIDPFPSLIIQDETHLLEESLGTFSGIFETTFEKLLNEIGLEKKFNNIVSRSHSGHIRMPKIIAATATVSEPERQMGEIYQRDVNQFPYPGPDLYNSFYASPLKRPSEEKILNTDDEEISSQRARIYASIMTNGKPHTSTSVELLANFHLIITQLLKGLNSDESSKVKEVYSLLISAISDEPTKLLYEETISKAEKEVLATLVDLHRISLTYVTNKKGGDQIMAAENDTTHRLHQEANITDFEHLCGELISGAVSAGEIQTVISKAEKRPDPGMEMENILSENIIRSVIATSAISHGVDVDEFNSMFFAGMPSNISEYIQASSRVGRTHVGFCLLIPTPQRRRDRYILEINDVYHRFLERMVRPAAVNRWAETALIRVLPSIFFCYLIAMKETIHRLEKPDDDKESISDFSVITSFKKQFLGNKSSLFLQELYDFLADALGFNEKKFGVPHKEKYINIISNEIRNNLINEIENNEELLSIPAVLRELDLQDEKTKRNTMTSLRDVDPAGNIHYRTSRHGIDSEEAFEIIKLIRKGYKG